MADIPQPMPEAQMIETNGIRMAVHRRGAGPVLLLAHGFPDLAYSWRYQFGPLVEAGYQVIAPDLRGFGATGPQGAVEDYRFANLSRDLIGLLDVLRVDRATLIGHDFGGALAWATARDYPDRIEAVISLNTPYTRRTKTDLVATMREARGPDNYIVQFQKPGLGEALLEKDIRATFRRLMRRPGLPLAQMQEIVSLRPLPLSLFVQDHAPLGEALLSEAELDVYVEAFTRTGFTGGLNWYRNLHRNWLDTAGSADIVTCPALMISASDDIYLPPSATRGMECNVPKLDRLLIESCGHWTQMERPEAVNAAIIGWLSKPGRRGEPE